jgi:hypothetical protein
MGQRRLQGRFRSVRELSSSFELSDSLATESGDAMNQELQELVERARKIEMTPDQLREQRRSFVYGNTHIENERITREMVAEADARLEAENGD